MKNSVWSIRVLWAVVAWLMAACAAQPVVHTPSGAITGGDQASPQHLVVFLDGTANHEGSYTNVAKLRNLVSLQARTDIQSVYIEGVGANGNVLGLALGAGIGRDVRQAYAFLLDHYQETRGDSIDLFGFSRGAYAARVLAGLLETAGLPPKPVRLSQSAWVNALFEAYKGEGSLRERRERVSSLTGHAVKPVRVRFAGLWESIEALGLPDYREDVIRPNRNYLEQMCNVASIAHALAVDDDRARVFTPILFTAKEREQQCGEALVSGRLRQVWFAGAHADVGGGYREGFLSGVSLNWMLDQWRPYGLLPTQASVVADPLGPSHDPESGLWGLIYRQQSRDLKKYSSLLGEGRLCVHPSVFTRLEALPPKAHEYDWYQSWPECFDPLTGGRLKLKPESACFGMAWPRGESADSLGCD